MRSSPNSVSWESLVVVIGMVWICFSGQLSGPVLVAAESSDSQHGLSCMFDTDSSNEDQVQSEMTGGFSKRLRLFASMLSGHFTNEDQRQNEIDSGQSPRASHTATFTPVLVQLFHPSITFFFEEALQGQLVRRHILVVEENVEGMVTLTTCTVTRPLPERPGSVDLSSLEDLTLDELEYIDGCDPTYSDVEHEIFFGKWPECKFFTPGSNIFYPGVITCEGMTFLSPTILSDPENGSQVPLHFKTVQRFHLLD